MFPTGKALVLAGAYLCVQQAAQGQLDPFPRELIQVGYQANVVGKAPVSAYGYYYLNEPSFLRTNLTLRLAISPVYVDGELGVKQALGPYTDVGLGINGGGFAYNYAEIKEGQWSKAESWTGDGAGLTASIYHLFNPADRIPLFGLLRGGFSYAAYVRDDMTAPTFVIPDDQPILYVRTGVRYGGQEPDLAPDMAMELSAWYEGQIRLDSGPFGYNGDRAINPSTHQFWARAMLQYTVPETKHYFGVAMNAATSIHPDRLSAYRIGGQLMLISEFPYSLPGYYFAELSTKNMLLFTGFYELPIDHAHRWRAAVAASTALCGYTPGLEMPNTWNSGVGGGISYHGPGERLKVALNFGYGIDAMRDGGRGGYAVAIAMQIDMEKSRTGAPGSLYRPERPSFMQRLMQAF
jgi:hypothetical protein